MPTCRGMGSAFCDCRGECAAALTTLRAGCRQDSSPLDGLCRDLWPVVYRTMRRRGGSLDEAADLTQAFFLQVIESRSFARARLASGCFRPYLVAAVRNFLRNEREREHAVKRGGHLVVLGGFDESHTPVCASLTSPGPGDPDALLDRARFEDAWKAALDRAVADARDPAERRRIELLLPHLDGLDRAAECACLAGDLGMTPGAVRVALHRLRRKVGSYLTSATRNGA